MSETRVGLLGWPVSHSRSPAMHNAAFRALGLPWEYLLLPVPPDELGEAMRRLRGELAGANVTVPHKQAVMDLLDTVSPEAQAIGAVNTIINRDGQLLGENTDARGFLEALREGGCDPTGQRVVVLGAGGASRAVLWALLGVGARVTLVNRTVARAEALAATLGGHWGAEVAVVAEGDQPALGAALAGATLLVNATSVGMAPASDALPLPPGAELHPALTVYDLVYNPLETRLLAFARKVGAIPIDGLGMLVHQGAAAFTLWTGHPAPVGVMRAAALGV